MPRTRAAPQRREPSATRWAAGAQSERCSILAIQLPIPENGVGSICAVNHIVRLGPGSSRYLSFKRVARITADSARARFHFPFSKFKVNSRSWMRLLLSRPAQACCVGISGEAGTEEGLPRHNGGNSGTFSACPSARPLCSPFDRGVCVPYARVPTAGL